MPKIHWILQSNLIKENTFNIIKKSLQEQHISYEEVRIIPFSDELPTLNHLKDINVFYGSTTLVLNAYKTFGEISGIFYNPNNFSMQTYIEKWHYKMLNYDSRIARFSNIVEQNYKMDSQWFVRPIEDDKSFSGRVMSFQEIIAIEKELKHSNNPYLTTETLVAISTPKFIEKEWRLFVINKEIISACRYTMNGELNIDKTDIPETMIQFAKKCCIEFTPADIFVMDIALYNSEFKIVECNCFNDSGFYEHDIEKIITEVNLYLLSLSTNS